MTARYIVWNQPRGAWLDGTGYTINLHLAARFTLEQARQRIEFGRGVLMMAPESVDLMLTYVADQLADPGPGRSIIVNSDPAEPTFAQTVPDEVAMATVATILDEPTTAEVVAEKRSADV